MADPFNVLVDLIDANIDATTITFKANPDVLTFGDVGWLGGTRYVVLATPKAQKAGDAAEKDPKTVVISVTVKDKAGNSNTLPVTTFMLAARGAGTAVTGTDPTKN